MGLKPLNCLYSTNPFTEVNFYTSISILLAIYCRIFQSGVAAVSNCESPKKIKTG